MGLVGRTVLRWWARVPNGFGGGADGCRSVMMEQWGDDDAMGVVNGMGTRRWNNQSKSGKKPEKKKKKKIDFKII